MACSPSFVDHAIDLLSGLGPVLARRLFGGYGLYARGVMFALLDDDELFLKTDAETRGRFAAAGCRMWSYGDRLPETDYYRPPDEAHEDAEAMQPWAELGLEAALRVKAAKTARAAAAQARKAARERAKAGPKARPRTAKAAKAGARAKARKPTSRGRSHPR